MDRDQLGHYIRMRHDWMGDPAVPHGTVSWETPVCSVCDLEGDELYQPCISLLHDEYVSRT